ncbi:MAG: Zn-ribbon domain-containing protein [Nanobdellota archaeon]
MPHQCVRCGKLIEDGSNEILQGCKNCGGKLFFFIKKSKLKEMENKPAENLTTKDKKQIEKDVVDLIGKEYNPDAPVILNFESVRVSKPGKFELDLVSLFDQKKPLVYKLEEGKYMIDVATTFEHASKGSKRIKEK